MKTVTKYISDDVVIRQQDGMSCISENCINPENGMLTPDHFYFSGHIYLDGTRSRRTKCKMCESAAKAESFRRRANRKVEDEPLKKETDWAEFEKCPWDVRAANNVLKGSVISL